MIYDHRMKQARKNTKIITQIFLETSFSHINIAKNKPVFKKQNENGDSNNYIEHKHQIFTEQIQP